MRVGKLWHELPFGFAPLDCAPLDCARDRRDRQGRRWEYRALDLEQMEQVMRTPALVDRRDVFSSDFDQRGKLLGIEVLDAAEVCNTASNSRSRLCLRL